MVAIKASQVAPFVASPDPSIEAFLIYGPDAGLAREITSRLGTHLVSRGGQTGEMITIDDLDLANDPDRMIVEVQTLAMFGGRNAVRVKAGGRLSLVHLKELLTAGGLANYLLVEAGDLKKGAKLRSLFESSKKAVALPCYGDEGRDLNSLIDEELGKRNIKINPDARRHLVRLLGADRGLSRAELVKLALYAEGREVIHIEDIDMMIGDSSALTFDKISFAVTAGNLSLALEQFDRSLGAGYPCSVLLSSLTRHFIRMHRVCSQVDCGARLDASVKSLRPPLHFRRVAEFSSHCRKWPTSKLIHALQLTQQLTTRLRTEPTRVERIMTERLLLVVSHMGAQLA